MDNATCASAMGCAKSRDWLPAHVEVWAKPVAVAPSSGRISSEGASASAQPMAQQLNLQEVESLLVAMTMPQEAHALYGAPSKARRSPPLPPPLPRARSRRSPPPWPETQQARTPTPPIATPFLRPPRWIQRPTLQHACSPASSGLALAWPAACR